MKITKVDAIQIEDKPADQPGWRPIVCRVYTDTGLYGDGEAAIAYGVGSTAAYGMIQDLAKLIIGMNPLDTEVIWEKLYKSTFWAQNGGPIVFAGIIAIAVVGVSMDLVISLIGKLCTPWERSRYEHGKEKVNHS